MSFETVEYNSNRWPKPIPPHHVGLAKSGQCKFHTADLKGAKINSRVMVLVDNATKRLAIRRPRDGEDEHATHVRAEKSGKRGNINLLPGLRKLGIKPETGRYKLTTKDDLLILALGDMSGKAAK